MLQNLVNENIMKNVAADRHRILSISNNNGLDWDDNGSIQNVTAVAAYAARKKRRFFSLRTLPQ